MLSDPEAGKIERTRQTKPGEQTLELAIAEQRIRATLSGMAMNKIEQLVKTLKESVSEAFNNREAYETPCMTMYRIPEQTFHKMYSSSQKIYQIILATRNMNVPTKNGTIITPGTGLECDLEKLVEGAVPIHEAEYPIAPETDPKKELNRLRIINVVYGLIFRTFINPALAAYMNVAMIEKAGIREGMAVTDTEKFSIINESAEDLKTKVKESRRLLLDGTDGTEKTRLASAVESAVQITRLHYLLSDIRLYVDDIPQDICIRGSEHEVRQALLNILLDKPYILRHNEKKEVRVGFGTYGDNVVIYVRDNGPNIPHQPEDLIFKMAARHANSERRVADTSCAERYIQSIGGELHAANLAEGVEMSIRLQTLPPPPPN
ncbi:MAG: hypothetical protein KKD17_02030 [Nanoarchaeota archaeon]|nr:hypothetical protein [Nanoarchaeota archaeon]